MNMSKPVKIKNISLSSKSQRNTSGAVGEFIGFILFLVLVLGVIVPLIIEVTIYNSQGQELDRLTKESARKACSLMADPSRALAGDINQGSLGLGTDVSIMDPLVESVFQTGSAHFDSYQDVKFKIYDLTGQEIIPADNHITLPNGTNVFMVGTNNDTNLCPAATNKGTGNDWKYCINGNDTAVKQAMKGPNIAGIPINQDLTARMETLQPNMCPGGDCESDYRNRIEHCSVCATKIRQSIFTRSVPILGSVIGLKCDPNNLAGSNALFPCLLTSCASSKFKQYSGKRGYAPKYQQDKFLGSDYRSLEDDLKADSTRVFAPARVTPSDTTLFTSMNDEFAPVYP